MMVATFAPNDAMAQSSQANTLDVRIEPTWDEDRRVSFKVTFLDPGTENIHQHQDYDFVIIQDGSEIFRASEQTGQPVLHNVQGTLTVPYQFTADGDYQARVELLGIGLPPIPIAPEITELPVTVIPEFPLGAIGVMAAVMASTFLATRFHKLGKSKFDI